MTAMQRAAVAAIALGGIAVGFAAGSLPARDGASLRHEATCAAAAKSMARVELLFGTGRKHGAPVSDGEWQTFVDQEVTPRFPAGLTILDGAGQWQGPNGAIEKERAHMLVVWYTPSTVSEAGIEAIRASYKSRFAQDSVLRVDASSCISF